MASSSQRCRVFVGNIPYHATEKQLIEICEEVGPVVSFRLVTDRETGKPKGYAFCEYKDEETASSARRNLQGYRINGRQLRVDFAEKRERGLTAAAANNNADHHQPQPQPQPQPIGLHIAKSAASIMTTTLGGPQFGMQPQNQSALAHEDVDPLTLHLAKMTRTQLMGIVSDVKAMAAQNTDAARELLLSSPQLTKALFQAQIMLGMVSDQTSQSSLSSMKEQGPSSGSGTYSKVPMRAEKRNMVHDSCSESFTRPSKLMKLDAPAVADGSSCVLIGSSSLPIVHAANVAEEQEQQLLPSRPQFPPDVEYALLQQVLNLTPEQVSSLPSEQQQQIIQLHQTLRRDQMQLPS
ncbi:hypothetical protein RIF29_35537 [Crotalaria pallida]|uniref:RRM domain-containing protein n=1 Tax=Crotalaria pallida TaxID=3830 RepID=A0AAN9EFR3_CROPI